MTGPRDPAATAPAVELTYVEVLAAAESRRKAADDVVLRGMLQNSIHPIAPPKPRPA